MASNLNRAFMRAYAKDRKQSLPASPKSVSPNAASPEMPDAPRPAAPTAKPQHSAQHFAQDANRPAIAPQSVPAPKILSGRYMQTAAPAAPASASTSRVVAPKAQLSKPVQPLSEADAAAEATSVWQRIDAAHAQQPPHAYASPSRRVTSSVGVGSATGPSRLQARAAAPVPPSNRAGIASAPQPVDLPLLTEGDNFLPVGDARAVETRRRTVADFLYSAGQVSASSASVRTTAAVGTSRTSTAPAVDGNSLSAGAFVGSGASALGMAAKAQTASLPPARAQTQTATSVSTPVPVRMPAREASVVEREQPSRMGQILRVDIPRGTRAVEPEPRPNAKAAALPVDQRAHVAPASAAAQIADQGATQVAARLTANEKNFGAVASVEDRFDTEQRRMDRAHELNATEQQLRRTKHKIFNPVWEVDTLQWPGVCDKLMAHRAESMTQVAAHLRAACDDGLSVLGVTSAGNGEGRTTVACCLARLAAAHGLNVVLVDLDLDHPTLCLQTNLEIEHDWRDCLTEDAKLEEVAVHSIDDQLTLLPLKPRGDRPGLLASEPRIAEILSELAESFELVIVDASRMHSSGNVISGLAHTRIFDASIIVVDRRNMDQERIEDAVRAVQQAGIESIGIVDNFSNA